MNELELTMSKHPELNFIYDDRMPMGLPALIANKTVRMNPKYSACQLNSVINEEVGHYATSTGDITDYKKHPQDEKRARSWGYENTITLDDLIECSKLGLYSINEIAEHFEVTPKYFAEVLCHYREKYGVLFCYHYCQFDMTHGIQIMPVHRWTSKKSPYPTAIG